MLESKITETELEIMRVLWDAGEPLTVTAIKNGASCRFAMSADTVKTLLRRLCKKGAVRQEKREVYYYSPVVSAEDYGKYSTQRIIDKLYSGSAQGLVAALVRNRQLRPEDIDELRAMFDAGGES